MEFIGPVGAINVTIATPIRLDAEFGIGALEFAFAARGVAVSLVASIVAVELTVAV